ncbi:MAG: hypothetical protein OEZ59_04650 [Deltaproteobacteria bacterium]|nr:hypothetical protein [Deltaproteobacteria bacterium]
MAGRNGVTQSAPNAEGQQADRFEALLEERFSSSARQAFESQLKAHDQERAPTGPDPERYRRAVRFRQDGGGQTLPDNVRKTLADWLAGMAVFSQRLGFSLGGLVPNIIVYTRTAFESEQGALPRGMSLPASSYSYDALNRNYTIRLVMADKTTAETLLTASRAVLARMLGDIFLRESVWTQDVYRQDAPGEPAPMGLEVQLTLLAQGTIATPALEQHLNAFARKTGMSLKKHPREVRKGCLEEMQKLLEQGRLPLEMRTAVEESYQEYLDNLRKDLDAELQKALNEVDELNRQVNFLPPSLHPEYESMRRDNLLHFLRSARLRLSSAVEQMASVCEDYETLDGANSPPAPLLLDRVAGQSSALEAEGLARRCLVPGVRLSTEQQELLNRLPLEVHALVQRMPPGSDGAKLYKSLTKRMESHLHQRIFNTLVYLRHWAELREKGSDDDFRSSETWRTLKGQVANFGFRLPLLRLLQSRLDVLLDLVPPAPRSGADSLPEFPRRSFTAVWGQFAAHGLVAAYFAEAAPLKGFDPARYWKPVLERWEIQTRQGGGAGGAGLLSLLLRKAQAALAGRGPQSGGLKALAALLAGGDGTFRFSMIQALTAFADGSAPGEGKALQDRLAAWSSALQRAHAERTRNAIRPGMTE